MRKCRRFDKRVAKMAPERRARVKDETETLHRETAPAQVLPAVRKTPPKQYFLWISQLKKRYHALQIKAAVAVNSARIEFYWNLGKDFSEKFAATAGYGTSFFNRLSADLRAEFPDAHGFSERNLKYCLDFYGLYSSSDILQQVVAKLVCVPWGHHCLITPQDNPPIGVLICKEHNRVFAKFHLEKLGLPMGISDYEIKKILPTPAQLAKCYADAEAQVARKGGE